MKNREDEIKEAFKTIIEYMAECGSDVMNAKITFDDYFIIHAEFKIWSDGKEECTE